jgi:hypothetical protein
MSVRIDLIIEGSCQLMIIVIKVALNIFNSLLQIPPEACTSQRRQTAGYGQVISSSRDD